MIAVIDSSVAVKWYADETGSDLAEKLIGQPLVAPDLIRAEVATALWRKVQNAEIGREQTGSALPHLAASVTLVPSEPFAEQALQLAIDLGHPVYDCLFLILARTLDLPMVTSDKRLWTKTRDTLFGDNVIMLQDWEGENG